MKLSADDIDFIKNLSNEMNTQDTVGTAQPFAIALREEVTRVVPSGFEDETIVYWNESEYSDWDEFIESLKDYYEDENKSATEIIENMYSFSDLENSYESDEIEARVFYIKKEMEVKHNFFLTRKAYNEHIKINGHNLKNPDNYGIHLYRNKEMEKLIEIVHKLANEL